MIKFSAVHTNLTVADPERSVRFYEEAFGLKPVRHVDSSDGTFRLVFLEAEGGGHRLELTWFRERSQDYRPAVKEEELGFIPHLAFMPEGSYEEALNFHRSLGIVCFESEKRGVYFVKDPDGYWLEVLPRERALAGQSRTV
jgi:lactoylglutathione lyase